MRRRALLALAILLALGLGAVWGMGSLLMRPHPSAVATAVPPAEDFFLTTPDGLAIAATFWPGRDANAPAVLLLHGNGASRQAMAGNAAWLNAQGFAVLAIDFRGHGQSAPAMRSFGLHEARDAAAAFAWLKQRQGGAPVAVVGISLGGAASLLGEHGPLPADALVLQAVYPDIRHAMRNCIASRSFGVVGWLAEPLLSLQAWPRRRAVPRDGWCYASSGSR